MAVHGKQAVTCEFLLEIILIKDAKRPPGQGAIFQIGLCTASSADVYRIFSE